MVQRTFLRNDGWFQPVTAGDVGISTTTTTGFLTYLTGATSANVAITNTGFTTAVSLAQGTTGTWLAMGTISFTNVGAAGNFAAQLTDGATLISGAGIQNATASGNASCSLTGIITNPAGNIKLLGTGSGTMLTTVSVAALGSSNATNLTVIRIG